MTNISSFRGGVLSEVIGCPPLIVDQAVVDAIIQLCRDASLFVKSFEHDVDASADVDTTDNDSITIDLSTYVSDTLRPITVKELKIDGAKWETTEKELENDVADISLYGITSTKFFNFPTIGTIKIYPMDTTDDVAVYLDMVWVPLRTMTSIDDFIFDNHREAVEARAKWNLMNQPEKKWTNIDLAMLKLSEYSRKMEEAKIAKLMGYTFGSMRVKQMRFF